MLPMASVTIEQIKLDSVPKWGDTVYSNPIKLKPNEHLDVCVNLIMSPLIKARFKNAFGWDLLDSIQFNQHQALTGFDAFMHWNVHTSESVKKRQECWLGMCWNMDDLARLGQTELHSFVTFKHWEFISTLESTNDKLILKFPHLERLVVPFGAVSGGDIVHANLYVRKYSISSPIEGIHCALCTDDYK
jgi:hypothetical protein